MKCWSRGCSGHAWKKNVRARDWEFPRPRYTSFKKRKTRIDVSRREQVLLGAAAVRDGLHTHAGVVPRPRPTSNDGSDLRFKVGFREWLRQSRALDDRTCSGKPQDTCCVVRTLHRPRIGLETYCSYEKRERNANRRPQPAATQEQVSTRRAHTSNVRQRYRVAFRS